ncbi:MAG: hypothetical protein DMF23_10490 [Verrucomicrobia bacterium]|nr:MAG: hypothetical protein DMF23_10490 [Verrucomicrobiota bacterium]
MDNRIAEAREIDWLVEVTFKSLGAVKRGSAQTAECRMGYNVLLQTEEVVFCVVRIAATNAGAILRDITERG